MDEEERQNLHLCNSRSSREGKRWSGGEMFIAAGSVRSQYIYYN